MAVIPNWGYFLGVGTTKLYLKDSPDHDLRYIDIFMKYFYVLHGASTSSEKCFETFKFTISQKYKSKLTNKNNKNSMIEKLISESLQHICDVRKWMQDMHVVVMQKQKVLNSLFPTWPT